MSHGPEATESGRMCGPPSSQLGKCTTTGVSSTDIVCHSRTKQTCFHVKSYSVRASKNTTLKDRFQEQLCIDPNAYPRTFIHTPCACVYLYLKC